MELPTTSSSSDTQEHKPVRVWIDMCADMFHFGHANALRQAKSMGDILVVGLHPDEEITKAKGPPVMNEKERLEVVKACKWVDEVTLEAPYQTLLSTLEKFNIDFCVHGEDLTMNSEGRDSYEEVRQSGKFKLIKRTEGVSSTDIVGRMLLLTKNHFNLSAEDAVKSVIEVVPKPLTLSSRLVYLFSSNGSPKPEDKVCYMDGAFDLFHAGHVNALRQAKALGDWLIVGVHSDLDANRLRGNNFPIMNLHERALSVLSCRYVDEVVIGCPLEITEDFIDSFKISCVVHGDERDDIHPLNPDPYLVPKEKGIYTEIKSTPGLSSHAIVERIIENRAKYQQRNKEKAIKEAALLGQQKQQTNLQ